MNQHPPNLDPSFYGWMRDKIKKILCQVGLPEGTSPAPPEFLNLIKCNCSSKKPCFQADAHMFSRKWLAVQCVNAVVIHNVVLTKKQYSLTIYLQMMRIKKYALV